MICLPAPYEDEILYSLIARYLIHTGLTKFSCITKQLADRQGPPSVCLPTSLEIISKRLSPLRCKTGEQIAYELTLFPYYSRYMSKDQANRCLEKMLASNGAGVQLVLGITACRIKMPRYLRFCPACRKADIEKFGETYWRRTHQLPGVIVCPEHNQTLIASKALMNPTGYGDYADATDVTTDI